MNSWQFTDTTNTVVFFVHDDGRMESMLVTATEIQAWLAAGNTPAPAPVVLPGVPQIVTMRQARLALLGAGLLPMVDAAIAALPSPQREAALIEWDYSSEVHRNRAFVLTLAAALNLSTEQLDSLFTQAATL